MCAHFTRRLAYIRFFLLLFIFLVVCFLYYIHSISELYLLIVMVLKHLAIPFKSYVDVHFCSYSLSSMTLDDKLIRGRPDLTVELV